MVGMEVRHDHRRKPRSAEDRLPCRPTGVGTKTRVEHRPAIVIFDQIDVHVIESVGQRQPEPPDTRSDLDEYAGRGWLGVGKYQTGGRWSLLHYRSLAWGSVWLPPCQRCKPIRGP